MNKIKILLLIALCGLLQLHAQKRANYFGKKVFIGWDYPIRVFGFTNDKLGGDGFGLGKIKIEKLTNANKMVGVSYGIDNYLIHDERIFYSSSLSSRHLKVQNYTIFKKWFRRSRAIAPIGRYTQFSLMFNRFTVKEEVFGEPETYGYFAMAYTLGKSFPLFGGKLIGNVSLGLNLSLLGTLYSYGTSNHNLYSSGDIVDAHIVMNMLKLDFGISYPLF